MRLRWPRKDPSDVLDYQINWADALEADTISTSTWTVPAGSSLTINSSSSAPTSSTVWLGGGVAGTHLVTNSIVTAGGRTIERSVELTVEER